MKPPMERRRNRIRSAGSLLAAALFCGAAATANAAGINNYNTVTDAGLNNPEPHNWLMYRGTYDSTGYSRLDQINTENVSKLVPVWTFSTGMREGHQAPPIVNEGVMFITTPHNRVIALDARTGEQIWRYDRELPEDQFQMHPTNRGVGLHGDLVYLATADCYVVAYPRFLPLGGSNTG